jgi:hypothetical protein
VVRLGSRHLRQKGTGEVVQYEADHRQASRRQYLQTGLPHGESVSATHNTIEREGVMSKLLVL